MTKICYKCNLEKLLTEFHKRKSAPDGHYRHCKSCENAYQASRWDNLSRDKKDLRNQQYRDRQAYFNQIRDSVKIKYGCGYCDENTPICLDFHHLESKDQEVNAFAKEKSLSKLIAEINKCMVLCSNCHRKLHKGLITIDVTKRCIENLEDYTTYKEFVKNLQETKT